MLHTNAINSAFLPDIIRMFESKGWKIVAPLDTFADPLYSMESETLPAGERVLWSLAKEHGVTGLRYPAEYVQYEPRNPAVTCFRSSEKITLSNSSVGGREGFIPAPGELVSKGLFELSEYPYLRKYLARKRQFESARKPPVSLIASLLGSHAPFAELLVVVGKNASNSVCAQTQS